MNWNKWMRQIHRWLSVVFTILVVVNGITVAQGRYNQKLGLAAVFPLLLLLLTGLYLLALPYVSRWRGVRRSG